MPLPTRFHISMEIADQLKYLTMISHVVQNCHLVGSMEKLGRN